MKRRTFAMLVLAAVLGACGSPDRPPAKFHATDISGVEFARGFDLTDHAGGRRTLDDFRGKVVLVFFGFTNCPDACPTALAEMAEVVKRLGPDAHRAQGIFITVDPERDSAERLASYVTAFHPSFVGLRGTADELVRTAKEFKMYYRLNKESAKPHGGHYTVDHTSAIFIFDPKGRVRLYASENGRTTERLVEDIRRLLAS